MVTAFVLIDVERGRLADVADRLATTEGVAEVHSVAGRYDLVAVLTHKGRSADSGHYVAWARDETDQAKKRWLQYDDDDVIERTGEEVLALSGGGDWHMAYLLLYKAELAP